MKNLIILIGIYIKTYIKERKLNKQLRVFEKEIGEMEKYLEAMETHEANLKMANEKVRDQQVIEILVSEFENTRMAISESDVPYFMSDPSTY